jgi:aminocarboxymuconate-semialdehyde decarboxylase
VITDVHNHAIPETAVELVGRDPAYGATVSGGHWRGGVHVEFKLVPSFIDPGAKLAELDAKGLEGAVISVAPPLFYYHVDPEPGEAMARAINAGLAEMAAEAPDRLRWLATVPLQTPGRAVAVLEEAMAAAGCVGVEIGTAAGPGRRLDEDALEPFWAAAERLAAPVTLHPAYTEPNAALGDFYLENVIGFPLETTVALERLICAGVLDRHPGLRLVLVHAGGFFPWQAGRLRHARTVRPELASSPTDPWSYLPQLWFDPITHDRDALAYLVAKVGAGNVVMGTDLPFDMATPEPVRELRAATDEDAAAAITELNPASLYGAAVAESAREAIS